jgi:hypothetical protein
MRQDDESFADVKFTGGRYEQHGLPVSSMPELERYERIIVEVAKELWRTSHSDRQRLPTRFGDQLALRLRAVRDGSVVPVLQRARGGFDLDDVFDQARDRVDAEFAKIVTGAWDDVDLPPRAMQALKRFGATLQDGEAFVFRASDPSPIRYDQSTRRRYLSRESGATVEQVGDLFGVVRALDAEDQTFRFTLPGRSAGIPGSFASREIFDDLHRALGNRETAYYRLACTYRVTAEADVVEISDVSEVEVFLSSEDQGGSRLLVLAQMPAGWNGANAPVIDLATLEVARDLIAGISDRGLTAPQVYPTESGGVQLEWHSPDQHTEVEIFAENLSMEAYHVGPSGEHHADVRGVKGILDFLEEVAP